MTIQNIKMPDIGEGIAEVELVAWRVAVGDQVTEDQILADVMTDKATVEIPSHVHGTVISLDAEVGQVVAVGTPIIHIKSAATQVDQGQVAMPIEASSATKNPTTADPSPQPSPTGRGSNTQPESPPLPQGEGRAEGNPTASRPLAAPAVRRRAVELGLDLAQIKPSHDAGRITHADLEQPATCSNKSSDPPRQNKGYTPLEAIKTIPVIGLRRKIAQKMQEAKRRIPHFTYVEEIDVTELEHLRAQLNQQHAATRGHLTLLPLLVRALVLAVREFPEVNARYDDDAGILTQYAALHLGLATQSDGGLMVPVIQHAEALDLWACAAEISRLAQAARSGKATREELTGSTLTLTSLGALGGIVSTPIINHPEVAIVGTNRIVERPMILGGAVVARKMMNLSSSFDHRVVDGMNAARFIQRVRSFLECPATLFVD
ncbi:dihydrolipoamide acetyltransferase family protein [Rhodoferax sp. BLA1]|uniref:dihydrolipoamide acetyltransferase family protein n=1 Tax=Rhodoferax sp. BLA1 TaxID=2576062 RepID=UPI0015D2B688|nr:dihydrolipoamide acetyltransferase family protein [Rhodoferax sp. BLA1]